MSSIADVAIVGGGIVGAACALECHRAGLRVEVYERSIAGGGATSAGMGHIVVMDDSEAQFALTHFSAGLWRELASELPASAEYLPCGTLWVATDEEEMAEVHRKQAYYHSRGVATEVLDAPSLAAAEPNLRAGLAGGLLVSGDSVVYPPVVAQWLLDQAGVTLHRTEVRSLADLPGGIVVNAAGAQAALLTNGIPVSPRKGHLVITDRHPGFVRHQLVELGYLKSAHSASGDSVAFNVQPRKTGQVLIGSSRQYGVEHTAIDRDIMTRMLSRAAAYMPGLGALTAIRSWTGFRAATPDKLPLIGPWEGRVWLATGHEGLGITTSLGTGRLLADLITGRTPPIPAAPYLPARYHQ